MFPQVQKAGPSYQSWARAATHRRWISVKIEAEIVELRTRHDFNIARAAAPPARHNVWVRVSDDAGGAGWGEAAPNAYYDESAESVMQAIHGFDSTFTAVDSAADVTAVTALEAELLAIAPNAASARAAVSAALLDLVGRRAGASVARLLEVESREQHSSFTIGIDELARMRDKVREAASYRILKIKVGTSHDEQILDMLRAERPDAIIRVDANTAWSAAEAIAKLPMLEAFGIELIEQPLSPQDYDGLAQLKRVSRIPIIADESCKVAGDVEKLAGCVHGVNIKLAKCGSLLEAVRIARAARQQGMQVMLGCMIESTLGIAAAMQLAGLADYVDLDGAALLAADPFVGPGIGADGRLRRSDAPGLGVSRAG